MLLANGCCLPAHLGVSRQTTKWTISCHTYKFTAVALNPFGAVSVWEGRVKAQLHIQQLAERGTRSALRARFVQSQYTEEYTVVCGSYLTLTCTQLYT